MIKKSFYIICTVLVFTSCDYLGFNKHNPEDDVVASVNQVELYRKDLRKLLPENITKEDSLVLVKNVINNWAKHQLLLQNAEKNLSKKESREYSNLVTNYKEGLLINGYKERLIKQRLDTIISDKEISDYYEKNKENFKLNEELIQLKYLHLGKDIYDKAETIKLFKSNEIEDTEKLESQYLSFKDYSFNDSTWVRLHDIMLKKTIFSQNLKDKLLKKTKFIQKEDSLGLYLVAVKDVLNRNDIAPLSYIKNTIKQMILHKRKLELIREIEKTIINDAIQNKSFKEY